MQRKTWVVIGAGVLVVAGIGALTGGEDSEKEKEDTAKPAATAPAKPADKPSKEAPKSSGVPSPDPEQTAALIRALGTIEPGLVVKEARAVDRARNVCSDIKAEKPAATVQGNAKTRYEGGTVPSLTDKQAADIVTAVKSSFCG
ncbi:hypothetical protein ACFZB6_26545 [Streptomyces syringium]|uniref:hypothetical protein n=1 Tax=Streptomyces syringium TaxID=76729 RepID=UPI0036F0A397